MSIMGIHAGTGRSKNITVYRITPRNYTGMTNLDTGDARGDVFFGIYELSIPELCKSQSSSHLPQCENVPILSIPNFNVYEELIMEYEDRFGEYNECNPNPSTGIFECRSHGERQCWYEDDRYASDFTDVCSKSECHCEYISTHAVGKEPLPFGSHTPLPPKWPAQCRADFVPYQVTIEDNPEKTLQDVTQAECCTKCSEANSFFNYCAGYAYNAESSECEFYKYPRHYTKPTKGTTVAFRSSSRGGIFGRIAQFSDIMNGTWYSTEAPGECKAGQVVGQDCAWRLVKQTRNVNATCVNDNVVKLITARNESCFDGCGTDKHNRKSTCWIECLFDIISGTGQSNPPMTAEQIVAPFKKSFESSDPADGGCPEVPPCPSPWP